MAILHTHTRTQRVRARHAHTERARSLSLSLPCRRAHCALFQNGRAGNFPFCTFMSLWEIFLVRASARYCHLACTALPLASSRTPTLQQQQRRLRRNADGITRNFPRGSALRPAARRGEVSARVFPTFSQRFPMCNPSHERA